MIYLGEIAKKFVNIIVLIYEVQVHELEGVLDALRCDPCVGGAFKRATDLG